MSELMEIILHRRSIRRFDERQIEEEVLQQILEAGLYAPSAGGRQILLVSDPAISARDGLLLRILTDRRFCRNGGSGQIIML